MLLTYKLIYLSIVGRFYRFFIIYLLLNIFNFTRLVIIIEIVLAHDIIVVFVRVVCEHINVDHP